MKVGHPYQRNGMGAIDENGQVPCGVCGHGPGAHAEPREHVVPRSVPGEKYERAYDLANKRGNKVIELREKMRAAETECERLRAALVLDGGARNALVTAVSLLENYGQHHGWCDVTTSAAPKPCTCRFEEELFTIKAMRDMFTSGATLAPSSEEERPTPEQEVDAIQRQDGLLAKEADKDG